MALGTDLGNFSNILPEVLIKRVLVQNGNQLDKISLNIKTLIRDVISTDLDKNITDAIRNNSYFFVFVYRPGFAAEELLHPSSQARRELIYRTDPVQLRNHLLSQFGRFRIVYNLGELMRSEPVQSDYFLNSGTDVFDFHQEFDLKNIQSTPQLKVLSFTHLDINGLVDSMEEYSSVNLDFAENYINSPTTIGTNARSLTILRDNRVLDYLNVYIDSNAEVWTGPVHRMGEGRYMKGAEHGDAFPDPELTLRRSRNSKVLDNRNFVNSSPRIVNDPLLVRRRVQRENTDSFLRLVNQRKAFKLENDAQGVATPSTRGRIVNSLYDNSSLEHETLAAGEAFMSVSLKRDVYVIFNVNWIEILKRNSPFFHLMPSMTAREKDLIMRYSEVTGINLKRRRLRSKLTKKSRFLSNAPEIMTEEPPVTVSSNYPLVGGDYHINPIETINVVYENNNEEGVLTFRGKDSTLKREKGLYQYYVEYEFRDGFLRFFEEMMSRIDVMEKNLNDFIQFASIPAMFENVDGVQRLRVDQTGHYNPKTGEFTEVFKNEIANNFVLGDIIAHFITMIRFVDGDRDGSSNSFTEEERIALLESAQKMLIPRDGATLETIMQFSNSFLQYKAIMDSTVGRYRKSTGKKDNKSSTPKGNLLGDIKFVDYFDLVADTDALTRPLLNYFSRVPIENDEGVRDLAQQLTTEQEQYGFSSEEWLKGAFLTPENMQFPIFKEEEDDNNLGAIPQQNVNRFRRVSNEELVYEVRSDENPGFDDQDERAVEMLVAYTGNSKDGPSGEKRRRVPNTSPLTPVQRPPAPRRNRQEDQEGSQDSSYNGDIGSFSNDVRGIAENFGILMNVNAAISNSSDSLLRDRSRNVLNYVQSLEESYEVLKKLTLNHINQLKDQAKYSKNRQRALDQGDDQVLSSFMQNENSSNFLSMIRALASFDSNFASLDAFQIDANISTSSEIASIRYSAPPQFNRSLITSLSTPGVMSTGALSSYVHGSLVEVKEVGSTFKGIKTSSEQTAINTDLGKRNEDTMGNLNKVNVQRLRPLAASSTALSPNKRYRLCKLIPYERPDLGIFKDERFSMLTIAHQYFFVEV